MSIIQYRKNYIFLLMLQSMMSHVHQAAQSRRGQKGELGNAVSCGICHSFAADGRCISLLKILMTNHCVYDCKYCINRASNDVKRATFTPEEICNLTVEFYKRNYIEGLFLSSGILKSPTYTMEKMCETLLLLRTKYHFNGYIHVKTIPGASDELLAAAGYLADRVSVNLELPTSEDLRKLAPNKTMQTILSPMGKVQNTIAAYRMAIGKSSYMERSRGNQFLHNGIFLILPNNSSKENWIAGQRCKKQQMYPQLLYSQILSYWILPSPGIRHINLHHMICPD